MRIALGADHHGVDLKIRVKQFLDRQHLAYEDFGPDTSEPVDYPDYAASVARSVASGTCDRGILICASGIGMAMAANKVRGVRAAPVTTQAAARATRRHNDANVLTLGAGTLAGRRRASPSSRPSSPSRSTADGTSAGSTRSPPQNGRRQQSVAKLRQRLLGVLGRKPKQDKGRHPATTKYQ